MKTYYKNPRIITEKQFTDLYKWLKEFGDLSGITHNLNMDEIITGNQRGRAFDINNCQIEIVEQFDEPDEQGTVALGFVVWEGKKYNYRQVRWDARKAEAANVIANRAGGTWDMDILANQFELSDLLEWGFEEYEFGITNEELYTGKITTPTYEPTGDIPSINDLVNQDKVKTLLETINTADGVSEDEKGFLRIAAYRHYVFNFKRIANYYASASLPMQRLMEESALVIIDFNKAIELGYAKLTDEISELMQAEYGNGQ